MKIYRSISKLSWEGKVNLHSENAFGDWEMLFPVTGWPWSVARYPLTPSPQQGGQKKIRCKKPLMGQEKNNLVKKTYLALLVRQKEELICYFPLAGRCPATSWKEGPQHACLLNLASCGYTLTRSPLWALFSQD